MSFLNIVTVRTFYYSMSTVLLLSTLVAGCSQIYGLDKFVIQSSTPDTDVSNTINDKPIKLAKPPSKPTVEAKTGKTVWYHVTALDLAIDSTEAWRSAGYDLDTINVTQNNLIELMVTKQICQQPAGATVVWALDGDNGIDNNFSKDVGYNILRLAGLQDSINNALKPEVSRWALLLKLENVTEDDNVNVKGSFFAALKKENGLWPIAKISLKNQELTAFDTSTTEAASQFPNGYLRDGVWVNYENGSNFDFLLIVSSGAFLKLPALKSIFTVDTKTKTGRISGGIKAQALLDNLRPVAGGLNPALCATFGSVKDAILRSADLVANLPKFQDERTCDAISFGFNLTFEEIPENQIAKTIGIPGAVNNPCPNLQ